MPEFVILLLILIICCVLCGPAALIVGIIALNKINNIRRLSEKGVTAQQRPIKETIPRLTERIFERPVQPVIAVEKPIEIKKTPPTPIKPMEQKKELQQKPVIGIEPKVLSEKADVSFEQKIGTKWVLIAGVITVIVGVGFFLKYAYDNNLVGPLGRVVISTIAGLVALSIGEITRRRSYDIVAKGVTSLGFAILYAAVFSACGFYHLIDSGTAFVFASLITAAAMLYAVSLNEIVIALLSLLGGFLTPVLVSTGENLPMPLFSYLTILGIGGIFCAYYRKWRAVNLLCFVGTFVLYTGWFEKFYRPVINAGEGAPTQMTIALGWLGVFFVLYLILPMLYELIKKVKVYKEDVLLVLANAAVTFYYLWTILFAKYRVELAFCALGLCAAHLIIMAIVAKRCEKDLNFRLVLLIIGLFFLTIAIPLYLKMYAVAMAWAVEGVVLAFIGLRYRSLLTQIGGGIAIALSLGQLTAQLPMHTGAFRLALNPAFGTWCFVAGVIFIWHILYRRQRQLEQDLRSMLSQLIYSAAGLVLLAAMTMEWYLYCRYNLVVNLTRYTAQGQMIIFAAMMVLFIARWMCPRGKISDVVGMLFLAAGLLSAVVTLTNLHSGRFTAFANLDFMLVLLFIAAVLIYHTRYRLISQSPEDEYGFISQILYGFMGGLLLAVTATEWYWHCRYNFAPSGGYYPAKGWVVIFSAIMMLFVVRPLCPPGIIARTLAAVLAGGGAIFTLITFTEFHRAGFIVFANSDFAIALIFVAALFLSAWLLYRESKKDPNIRYFTIGFVLIAIFTLWVLLTEEIYSYWYCQNRHVQKIENWFFLAQMYISVMWAIYGAALMIVGFWRKNAMLRYIALGFFALLLVKVFIMDTEMVKSAYRIAAFMATGVTLVAMSYLYQYLKKKGFFDAMLAQKNVDKLQ